MTPKKRDKLKNQLADHGLTVLCTSDYSAILLQLSRLAQFERLMIRAGAGNPPVEFAIDHVLRLQRGGYEDNSAPALVPLEPVQIPWLLQAVNVSLQTELASGASFSPERSAAAVQAYTAILCRR